VVLFNDVVKIFRPPDSDQPTPAAHHEQAVHVEQTSRVRSTFVDDDRARPAVIADRFHEERSSCGFVAALRQHEIKGFPLLVILVQTRRNAKAAMRFFERLVVTFGEPRVVITDKLRSYTKPIKTLAPRADHRAHKGLLWLPSVMQEVFQTV